VQYRIDALDHAHFAGAKYLIPKTLLNFRHEACFFEKKCRLKKHHRLSRRRKTVLMIKKYAKDYFFSIFGIFHVHQREISGKLFGIYWIVTRAGEKR
jgi:hypothetical protein